MTGTRLAAAARRLGALLIRPEPANAQQHPDGGPGPWLPGDALGGPGYTTEARR